jgi:hypothetical protein
MRRTIEMRGAAAQPVAAPHRGTLWTRKAAAVLCIAAGLVHLWIAPEHFRHWTGYGVFFGASAAVQIALAVALLAWSRRAVVLAGLGATAALIAVYTVSRTTGVRVGPHGGPEQVGDLDFLTVVVEMFTVVLLLSLLNGAHRRWVGNALLALGVGLVVLRVAAVP